MKKKIITITCVVCLVLLFATLSIVSYLGNRVPENPAGTVGNTSGNFYNGGMFCENGGVVYFSNPYDNNALYSMNPDESNMKKLLSVEVSCLNADSKYIYFYQSSSGTGPGIGSLLNATGVFRVQKNNMKKIVCLDRTLGKYLILVDNAVYYTDNSDESVKKSSIDGKEKETLDTPDSLPVSVHNSTFYFPNNKNNLHLMALNLKSGSTRPVLAYDIYMPIVEGSTVYGIDIHDNYSLISMTLDGTKTLLDSDRTDMLNVTENYIYYQTSGDNPQLKRIRRDGSDMEVVAKGTYNSINSTSQYVYFTGFGSTTPVYKTPAYGAVNVTTFDSASQAAQEALKK